MKTNINLEQKWTNMTCALVRMIHEKDKPRDIIVFEARAMILLEVVDFDYMLCFVTSNYIVFEMCIAYRYFYVQYVGWRQIEHLSIFYVHELLHGM